MTLLCQSDFGNDVYLDPDATLTATVVPTATNLVTHPIGQVALPDAGGAGTDVVSQHMAAGAWRITTQVISGLRNPNNSYGGGSDFVRCRLWANGTSIDGGATVLVSTSSNVQETVNAGTFTTNAGWSLRLSSAHDTGISTGQHWTILDGMAQAIRKGPIA